MKSAFDSDVIDEIDRESKRAAKPEYSANAWPRPWRAAAARAAEHNTKARLPKLPKPPNKPRKSARDLDPP